MFNGKTSKTLLLGGVMVLTLVLQGCSAAESNPGQASQDINGAREDYEFNPKLSPSFDNPWPTNVTRQEMVETALYKSFDFMEKTRVESCQVGASVFISDKVRVEHIPVIERISSEMNKVFCDYLSEEITIVSGGYDFLKEVVASEELPKDEFDGICGYEIPRTNYTRAGCASQGVAWSGVPLGIRGLLKLDGDGVATIPHEIFHLVQDTVDPGQSGVNQGKGENFFRPVWWVEGGGEFIGRLIPRYLEFQDYSFGTASQSLSDLERFELWGESFSESNDHYYAGQIALEYITASAGFGAVMETLELMGAGVDFEAAFEAAMGISVATFYDKFAILHEYQISN